MTRRRARGALRLAAGIAEEARTAGLGRPGPTREEMYGHLVRNPKLRSATCRLYRDGHYAQAVEAAFKLVCNEVKRLAPGTGKDGQDLMFHVFSEQSPLLRLNEMQTESDHSEQRGYKFLFGGVMSGVRNPRAHDHAVEDDVDTALELLAFANHLMSKLALLSRA